MEPERLNKMIEKNQCERGYDEGKKLHHPTSYSGVTIGPGIDLGSLSPKDVERKYGGIVEKHQLEIMKKGCSLRRGQADQFCKKNRDFLISQKSYNRLINSEVSFCEKDVKRIMDSDSMYKKYKGYNKDTLKTAPQYIRDIFSDMRYNGRFRPDTRQLIVPKLVTYQKAIQSGDHQKARNILSGLDQSIVKIYKNPEVGGLRNDPNRGNKIQKYINENKDNDISAVFSQSKTDSTNSSFYSSSDKVLKDISNNKNQIGGIDLGFDVKDQKFIGFHCGSRGFSLKNDCNGSGVSLSDIIVPLKIMADSSITAKTILVSLDPLIPTEPDGPLFKKVYIPSILEGTPIGNVMIEADYLMKQLNLGVDHNNQPFNYPKSLIDIGLDFATLAKKFPKNNLQLDRARLWIVIEDAQIKENPDGCVEVGQVKMGIKGKMQEIGEDGKLKDGQGQLTKHNEEFVNIFSKNYDLLEKQFPIFGEVKKLAKASVLARLFVERGCPINLQLVQNLYKQQLKEDSEKTKNRLEHKIETPTQKGYTLRRISGGCDFSIRKPQLLQPTKVLGEITNIPNFQKQFSPFILQEKAKCTAENCNNFCNIDYFSNLHKKCFKHTEMKCENCWDYIFMGQTYNKAENSYYHSKCMACTGCQMHLSQAQLKKIAAKDGKLYHQKCYPLGNCEFCREAIRNGEQSGSFEGATIHINCFQDWKVKFAQQMALSGPKCKSCSKAISGAYRSNGVDSWHAECYEEPCCEICKKPNEIVGLGERKVHLSCLKCSKCQQPLNKTQQFGSIGENKYIHVKCSSMK